MDSCPMKVRILMSLLTTFSPRGQLRRMSSSSRASVELALAARLEDRRLDLVAPHGAQRRHEAVVGHLRRVRDEAEDRVRPVVVDRLEHLAGQPPAERLALPVDVRRRCRARSRSARTSTTPGGAPAVNACSETVPRRLITTAWPGLTSPTSPAARSKTVMSGARSEANATTSSFWNQWQGRIPEGSRATNASPLPIRPQRTYPPSQFCEARVRTRARSRSSLILRDSSSPATFCAPERSGRCPRAPRRGRSRSSPGSPACPSRRPGCCPIAISDWFSSAVLVRLKFPQSARLRVAHGLRLKNGWHALRL